MDKLNPFRIGREPRPKWEFGNFTILSGITKYFIGAEPRAIRRSIKTERLDTIITSEKIGQKNTLKSIKSDQQNVQCGTVYLTNSR